MSSSLWPRVAALAFATICPVWAGTFGKVVPIGGQSSDLALDESRGVLYIANFTANRIEVMSLVDYTIQTSFNVAPQPSSLAMSPDNRFLVVTHFGNFAPPIAPNNALTVIDLTTNGKQTFALGNPPLGVAFGIDGRALVVTTTDYLLFDPVLGTTQQIDTITGVVAKTLPVPPANSPPQITTASLTSSGDGLTIFGLGGSTSTFTFAYDVTARTIKPGGIVTTNGALGPRVISTNQDGTVYMAGWAMVDSKGITNYFPRSTNQLNVGTTLFDASRGLLYSQIPQRQASLRSCESLTPTTCSCGSASSCPKILPGRVYSPAMEIQFTPSPIAGCWCCLSVRCSVSHALPSLKKTLFSVATFATVA